jgi:hypothetical protein
MNEGEMTPKVSPSGAAWATSSVPISEAAPGWLSTTIVGPPAEPTSWATRRAMMSAGPPAGNGRIILIVLPP